jgi:fibronectin type 3 domain-containing protein
MKNKFWGSLTLVALVFSSVFTAGLPAIASGVSINSGATSNAFTTPVSGQLLPSNNTSQRVSYANPLGGMYEVTAPIAGSTQVVIQAFNNGAMDTRFNTTGSLTFTAQYATSARDNLFFTTYANGTKWAVLENPWSHGNFNYLHLGTVSAGHLSTVTLPTTNNNDTTCSNSVTAARSGTSNLMSKLEFVPNTGFDAPLLSLKCYIYLNAVGAGDTSEVSWLMNYSGGTTPGTPATYTAFGSGPVGPLNLMDAASKKYIANYGVSVNPAATGSEIALTYFSAMSSTAPDSSPNTSSISSLTDYVVTRVTANGTITRQQSAWTGQVTNGLTGMLVVPPRNSGTVYALQHATDGTNVFANILTFSSTGAATAQTAVTGTSFATGFSRVASPNIQGSTLKFASIDLGGYNPSYFVQVDATTGIATRYSSFVLSGGGSFESFMWQMTDSANGADFYSRHNSTTVLRVAASTAPTAPAAPSAPSVVVGNGQATVSWAAPANGGSSITSYSVDYSANGGTSWTNFASNIATTSATVTGLTNGTNYVFRVSATNSVGTSSSSTSSTSVTPNPVPNQPTGLTVTGNGSNAVTLTWTAPSGNGSAVSDYIIDRSTNGWATYSTYVDGVSTATTFNTTGLTPGVSYSFRVSAVNGIGTSSPSTTSVEFVSASVPSAIASAPTLVASPGVVTLTWTPPSNGGSALTTAEVQYSTNGGSTWTNYTSSIDTSGTAALTGLTGGQAYVFRVRTSNFFGTTAWSSTSASVTAQPAAAPGTVTNLVVAAGGSAGTASLTWTAPNANGSAITDYTIEYSSDGGVTWQTWSHTASTGTSATVTGLTPGTNYQFRVTAVNGIGASVATTPSAPVAATAQPVASVPNNLPRNIEVSKKVDTSDGKVVFGGDNMEAVKIVMMNNVEAIILTRTPKSLTASIPKEVLGWVNVEFITTSGSIRFESLIYVENVKANQIAKLRLGFTIPRVLNEASSKRLTAVGSKFTSAKTATCVGYYSDRITRKVALANARTACELISGRNRKAATRLAVTKQPQHASVVVYFNY